MTEAADIVIRLAVPDDGEALSDIYRPAVADCSTSFELEPPDAAEMTRRVTRVMERTPWLVLAGLVVQGFRNAYAGITLPNPASECFHAALGFTPVGVYRGIGYKQGAWHDVIWLERPLAPRVLDPPLPAWLPEARENPLFRKAIEAGPFRADARTEAARWH